MSEKFYCGQKTEKGCLVSKASCEALNPRFDLRNHSPTGFEWGYEGSGPAQLALAILADYLEDDEKALELYQEFKRSVITYLKKDHFIITEKMILCFLETKNYIDLEREK